MDKTQSTVETKPWMREYTYVHEGDARRHRGEFIASGRDVSLIAFDPQRARYVFDVLS